MLPFRLIPFAAALLLAAPATAQGVQVPFGGLQHDSSLPVEVSADRLEVDQTAGDAVFTGNVVVGQGEMRLSAARLQVIYAEGGEGTRTRIDRMHATGGVVVTNAEEAAEAREAVYSIKDGNIVMTGDVILTQGRNAISGNRFTVDLNTGQGVMEGPVRTILQPEGDG